MQNPNIIIINSSDKGNVKIELIVYERDQIIACFYVFEIKRTKVQNKAKTCKQYCFLYRPVRKFEK